MTAPDATSAPAATAGPDATRPPDRADGGDPDRPVGHRHRWEAMAFELVDDRPVVRETCATCGLVRRYRAFERYWTPGDTEIRR